jgi:hypothetical protein
VLAAVVLHVQADDVLSSKQHGQQQQQGQDNAATYMSQLVFKFHGWAAAVHALVVLINMCCILSCSSISDLLLLLLLLLPCYCCCQG